MYLERLPDSVSYLLTNDFYNRNDNGNFHFFQEPISIFLSMVILPLLNFFRTHPAASKLTLEFSLVLL